MAHLLVLREAEWRIVQESANAAAFLGLTGPARSASARSGRRSVEPKPPYLDRTADAIPVALRCAAGARGELLMRFARTERKAANHRRTGARRTGCRLYGRNSALRRRDFILIKPSRALRLLRRLFRELTGYDRVMIYRFDDDGHGEVFAETRRPELEAFLGNRYPASDIPQIARRLYERNRVRLLVDVDYTPAPLEPPLSPDGSGTGHVAVFSA